MNIKELNEAIDKALCESTDVVSFNDLDELEDYIRKEHDFPDNFIYNNACYTMEEYDMEGYTITYASCDNEQGIRVETPDNRYDKNTDYVTMDINIEEYNPFGLRKDINYLSIDGNNYGIIDSDKNGLVWSKAADCFSIAVYNKFAKEDYEDAWVDLGKRKNDDKYTVYIKSHGLFDTLPEEVNNKEEAIEVVKKYLLNKLDIKDENNAEVKVKTFNESVKQTKSTKKSIKEAHIFTKDELANNRFVKLYQKCCEYRKEHPEMEAYEIANKLCFNQNEGWVNLDEIAQTWADMFVYDGAKDETLIQKLREDIVEMIEEYLLDDEPDEQNESVTDKKSMKEDVNTVYVLINNKVALNFEQDFDFATDVLDADGLKKRAEELDKNFEQNAKEANLGSPLMNDVLYAIKVLRNKGYFVLVKNIKSI